MNKSNIFLFRKYFFEIKIYKLSNVMNAEQLLNARLNKNWEQIETAEKLKVSQPYLSLLEAGKRPVTGKLARRAVSIFNLPPTVLPFDENQKVPQLKTTDVGFLDLQLAALGYPKFSHLKKNKRLKKVNPAVILITALQKNDLDSRTLEALPWLIFNFAEMNWEAIIKVAKLSDAQNRLGFLISLAYEKAGQSKPADKKQFFKELLSNLERSKLYQEDSFKRISLTKTEKSWLKKNRSKEARFWRVLTNLTIDNLVF